MAASVMQPLWAGATTLASPALRLLLRYRVTRGKEIGARLAERRGIDRDAPAVRAAGVAARRECRRDDFGAAGARPRWRRSTPTCRCC